MLLPFATLTMAAQQQGEADVRPLVYGRGEKPAAEPQQVAARMEGDTALVACVTVNGQKLTLRSAIRYPEKGQPPHALMTGTSRLSLPRQLFSNRLIATSLTDLRSEHNDYDLQAHSTWPLYSVYMTSIQCAFAPCTVRIRPHCSAHSASLQCHSMCRIIADILRTKVL